MWCKLCHNPLKKNDQLAVIALPIHSLDNEGQYSILGDFIKHERVVHLSCFKNIPSTEKLLNLLYPKYEYSIDKQEKNKNKKQNLSNVKILQILKTLRELGEKITIDNWEKFISLYKLQGCSDSQLIKEWFSRKVYNE